MESGLDVRLCRLALRRYGMALCSRGPGGSMGCVWSPQHSCQPVCHNLTLWMLGVCQGFAQLRVMLPVRLSGQATGRKTIRPQAALPSAQLAAAATGLQMFGESGQCMHTSCAAALQLYRRSASLSSAQCSLTQHLIQVPITTGSRRAYSTAVPLNTPHSAPAQPIQNMLQWPSCTPIQTCSVDQKSCPTPQCCDTPVYTSSNLSSCLDLQLLCPHIS